MKLKRWHQRTRTKKLLDHLFLTWRNSGYSFLQENEDPIHVPFPRVRCNWAPCNAMVIRIKNSAGKSMMSCVNLAYLIIAICACVDFHLSSLFITSKHSRTKRQEMANPNMMSESMLMDYSTVNRRDSSNLLHRSTISSCLASPVFQ